MQTYCTEFSRRTHLPITFEVDEALPVLPDIYNITLYRVLQEALSNIVKHARASHVWVDLSREDDSIILTVQDNGLGFKTDEVRSNGMGLSNMRERVTIAGGNFSISSDHRRGTILTARFLLPADHHTPERLL
jgi:two-component system NarL family sensor kinase